METAKEVEKSNRRYRRAMTAFAILFLISIAAILLLWQSGPRDMTADGIEDPRFVLGLTLVTAATSLAGFVSTTWLAWRKERRDAASYKLQVERQQLEIERLRLELEQERGREKVGGGS